MENPEMNGNRSSAIQPFLCGLGTGVALALLFAPRSGAETRRMIGRTAKDGEGWIKEKAGAAKEYVETHVTDLRERAKEVAAVIGRS
jgi:gas vesicle protein